LQLNVQKNHVGRGNQLKYTTRLFT
jgi:hypothetical protein